MNRLNAKLEAHHVLDATGLICPLPVVKASEAMTRLQVGQVLKVLATDPAAKEDLSVWAEKFGHEVLSMEEESGVIRCYLKKKR